MKSVIPRILPRQECGKCRCDIFRVLKDTNKFIAVCDECITPIGNIECGCFDLRKEQVDREWNGREWTDKVSRCPKAAEGFEPYHKWIPVSRNTSNDSDHVTMIMCGICFHEVNISEAFQYRDCSKT